MKFSEKGHFRSRKSRSNTPPWERTHVINFPAENYYLGNPDLWQPTVTQSSLCIDCLFILLFWNSKSNSRDDALLVQEINSLIRFFYYLSDHFSFSPSAKTCSFYAQRLLRHSILSQGIVLSDFSGLPVERNPFFQGVVLWYRFLNYSINTFHSLILLSSKLNLHLKQHNRLDKRKHNSFVLLTLDFLQSNTNLLEA